LRSVNARSQPDGNVPARRDSSVSTSMTRCLVALGSNLGDRAAIVARATELIRAQPRISALRSSGLYETRPIGGVAGQAPYLNAAVTFDADLPAEQLHDVLRGIENQLGRRRGERWSARSIDLDLLLVGETQIGTSELIVPHPRMAFRRFVLEPAAEVAPEMIHPAIGWSIAQLLARLDTAASYVALLGLPGSGKTALAQRLAATFDGTFIADPLVEPNKCDASLLAAASASRKYARQMEFLERRARRLARDRWDAGEMLAVSDFYIDQSLAYAERALGAEEMSQFRAAHQAASAQVVLPKLLVVTDTSPSAVPEPAESAADRGPSRVRNADASATQSLREELLKLADRREVAPVLYVGRIDANAQFAEVSAAVQAMQSSALRA
jgi:2-amino-4-hydroxy-6-hydroxymethyldihydropteridine diphosphokinase